MSATLAFDLLERTAEHRPADFGGLGVVFYWHLEALPRLALGDQDHLVPALPVSGLGAIASTLAGISSVSSPWHDGFHLVDLSGPALTHASQYLAPPIDLLGATDIGLSRATGARHMTALLVSQLEGVACVGLLTTHGEATVFERGLLVPRRRKI